MAKPRNPERVAAETAGVNVYEGPACLRGHTTKYVKNAQCVSCAKKRATDRVASDPEGRRAYIRQWYLDNQADVISRSARWRAENPDQFRASLRLWAKENPEKRAANDRLQRGRRRGAEGHHSIAQTRAILIWQNGSCAYCDVCEDLHLDHVIPIVRGGSNWPWNLQWLCAWHNMSKNYRTDAEYRELVGLPPVEPVSLATWRLLLFGF